MKKRSFSARCAPSSQLEPERCDPIMKKTGARGSLTVETLAESVKDGLALPCVCGSGSSTGRKSSGDSELDIIVPQE